MKNSKTFWWRLRWCQEGHHTPNAPSCTTLVQACRPVLILVIKSQGLGFSQSIAGYRDYKKSWVFLYEDKYIAIGWNYDYCAHFTSKPILVLIKTNLIPKISPCLELCQQSISRVRQFQCTYWSWKRRVKSYLYTIIVCFIACYYPFSNLCRLYDIEKSHK